ncbi:hypothetical protein J4U01_gp078 [Mycobacterium phage Kumao]|uniref:Uncharacterized protein n=1 Tax=Mycobacterium phage Kumao TaxID=2041344 RepID=A0A2D1GQ28_9CAUD|nr:hypothetical protein J4U01_gp078 [Mycobacterium phage Kumao]ATN94041.1 hypothetical protein SEA_KUMAO_78 [Mycobacterium phage Kumao]
MPVIPHPDAPKGPPTSAKEAYIRFLCKWCWEKPYRAGGTECEDCFKARVEAESKGEPFWPVNAYQQQERTTV